MCYVSVLRPEAVIGCHSLISETLWKREESGVGLFRGLASVLFLRGGGRGIANLDSVSLRYRVIPK